MNTSDFTRKLNALLQAHRRLPAEIAAIAEKFSKERFRNQNWLDQTPEPWPQRRRSRRGMTGRTIRNQTLLVKTGRLKRSIRKISVSSDQIIIGTDVPYARIHNEGGTISSTVTVRAHNVRPHSRTRSGRRQNVRGYSVRSHSRRMNLQIPKRQFVGNSQTLQQKILSHITTRFTDALNS